jgi:hypothetical protein
MDIDFRKELTNIGKIHLSPTNAINTTRGLAHKTLE